MHESGCGNKEPDMEMFMAVISHPLVIQAVFYVHSKCDFLS
jgi:hypothetical protein